MWIKIILFLCLESAFGQLCHNYTTCPDWCTDIIYYNTDNIASLEQDGPEFVAFQETVGKVLDYMTVS